MKTYNLNRNGFTLVEAMIAFGIGLVFLTSVLSAWFFSTKTWKEESLRSELRFDVERTLEKLKADSRLSDQNSMLFYPSTGSSSTYTAISVPYPGSDSSGFLKLNASNTIDWSQGKTIVYSVYNNGGTQEMRRTVFSTFNTDSTARQTQLNNVATNGTDSGGSTQTLFKADSITFQVTAANSTFDGYASSTQRSANTNFGGYRLSSGTHQIKFLVTSKNSSSSGYYVGIDDIALDPSGGPQEAEDLTVSTNKSTSNVDMALGGYSDTWSGNYQTECQATATNDYMTLQTNYDQWLESNFADMTHSDTEVSVASADNPVLTNASLATQGATPGWSADSQTGDDSPSTYGLSGQSVRVVIQGSSITKSAQMIRFQFLDSGSGTTIDSAYFGPLSGTAGLASSSQLCFESSDVAPGGTDPAGSIGCAAGTTTGPVAIGAGNHRWTSWFTPSSSITAGNGTYVVSYYCSSGSPMSWNAGGGAVTQSYLVNADHASGTSDWATAGLFGYSTDTKLVGIEEMSTWRSLGVADSQIYDTKMTSPVFNQISWTSTLPAGASVTLKVRSSANADMSSPSSWLSFTTSPGSLAALPSRRYLQFEAQLQAVSPYSTFPTVDKVKIDWPGQTALVQISGHYTKKPNYGIFQVLVDGNTLLKTLGVSLSVSKTYRGQTFANSLNTEIKPKNTGK